MNINFHNPNTNDETLKYIVKILFETGRAKLENVLLDNGKRNKENAVKSVIQ